MGRYSLISPKILLPFMENYSKFSIKADEIR